MGKQGRPFVIVDFRGNPPSEKKCKNQGERAPLGVSVSYPRLQMPSLGIFEKPAFFNGECLHF